MTTPGPGWARGFAAGGRPDPGMRVGDAERSQVADLLARHYADGRLDEAEFNERIDHAMKARTRGELDALFADLPGLDLPGASEPAGQPGAGPKPVGPPWAQGRPGRRLVPLILLIVLVVVVSHALARPFIMVPLFFPWLAVGALAFLWLRGGRRRSRR